VFILAWPLVTVVLYTVVPVPITNLMLFRLFAGHGIHKSWRAMADIAPDLPRAILAAEDQRFCSHHGVDWTELQDAMDSGEDGPSRGASTLTMQLAKNLYLWEGHSVIRKGLEMPLAYYMDGVLSKRRLMEIYLNVVEWAPGVYGAEAAAQFHFGKPAARLTMGESTLLAASLPNPFKRDAGHPSPRLRMIAGHIRDNMDGMGAYLACLD